jgi:hypothetical protein
MKERPAVEPCLQRKLRAELKKQLNKMNLDV